MKNKVVCFSLSQVMRMPDMIRDGYQRDEVSALFQELHDLGLGIYTPGTRGKGKAATFEFWVDSPGTHTMTFQVEKLHTSYAGKPESLALAPVPVTVLTPSIDVSVPISEVRVVATLLPQFAGEVPANPCSEFAYSVAIDGDLLRLRRDGGEKTIEAALKAAWGDIEARISALDSPRMSRIETVASKLRGLGFYMLIPATHTPMPTSGEDVLIDGAAI